MSDIRDSIAHRSRLGRRAAILPLVLFVVLLIGLLAAVFAFRVHADVASTHVVGDQLQARLAAEAGVEWVKLVLRNGRLDRSVWYSNPDAFHRIILWAMGADSTSSGTNEEYEEDVAYRFSIVADDPTDDETYIRFGITDEASKLNLNTATEGQLLTLMERALAGRDDVIPQDVVDAIIDWRDTDKNPHGEATDTEGDYYRALKKPYRVKNAPFDSVEELLLVKGITAELLYGEDFDRNGLLSDNEDDGDFTFPPDNQDNVLNRGLYPYLTAMSYESNVSDGNRPRVYLKGPEQQVSAELALAFPDNPEIVDFVVRAVKKPAAGQGGQGDGQGQGGEGGQGGGQGDGQGDQGQQGDGQGQPGGAQGPQGGAGADGQGLGQPGAGQGGTSGGAGLGGPKPPPGGPGRPQTPGTPGRRPGPPPPAGSPGKKPGPMKAANGQPLVSGKQTEPPGSTGNEGQEQAGGEQQGGEGQPGQGEESGGEQQGGEQGGEQQQGDGSGGEGPPGEGGSEGQGGSGDAGGDTTPIRSPADLMLVQPEGGANPLTVEALAILMDRTTMENKKKIDHVININTAPRPVLECIEGLQEEQINAILEAREKLPDLELRSPTWLLKEGIMEKEDFAVIAPNITTRAQQFAIESLGYADHKGMIARLQVVLDMEGPIAQVIYYRDLSYLGAPYPIREEDLEQQRGR